MVNRNERFTLAIFSIILIFLGISSSILITLSNTTVSTDNSIQIEKIASINMPGLCGIQVEDDIAYVGISSYGLKILDVSNPKNITLLGETNDLGELYHDIYVDTTRKLAYLAGFEYGLFIFNISDISNPTRIGDYNVGEYRTSVVHAEGNYAYLATSIGLEVLDVSDPANPIKIGGYETENGSINVQVINDRTYLSTSGKKLIIFDISNYSHPSKVGEYVDGDQIRMFYIDPDDNICVINKVNGIKLVDVSNSTNPEFLGENNNIRSLYTFGLFKQDNLAFIGEWEDGLAIVNISDPTDPKVIHRFTEDGGVGWVFVEENNIYIGTVSEKFIILRIKTNEIVEKSSGISLVFMLICLNLIAFSRRKFRNC